MSKKSKQPENASELQSIDLADLNKVSGGAVRAGGSSADSEVMTALTGVLDSLNSLKSQPRGGGFGPNEMMMFMMMLGGGRPGPQVIQSAPPGSIGGYAGYTIDGVFYPFNK